MTDRSVVVERRAKEGVMLIARTTGCACAHDAKVFKFMEEEEERERGRWTAAGVAIHDVPLR